MLYPPTFIILSAKYFIVNFQYTAIGRITDGMGTHLEIVFGNLFCNLFEMFGVAEHKTCFIRHIMVRV
ncbi:hypothetical protein D3C86_1735550 [compost metagenome]